MAHYHRRERGSEELKEMRNNGGGGGGQMRSALSFCFLLFDRSEASLALSFYSISRLS